MMTEYFHNDDDIERLAQGVIDGSRPKSDWTHAAHFAVTFWILRHRPDRPAETYLPGVIRNYNEAVGVRNTDTTGYHETTTQASIRAARAFLSRHPPSTPLHALIDLLMDTPLGDSGWILAHWSRDRLFSIEARRLWVAPDLQPMT